MARVDWFWELPALAAPALGFLGVAMALEPRGSGSPARARRSPPPVVTRAVLVAGLAAAVVVLAFPYLSVRQVSIAVDIQSQNPRAALEDFETAAELNPLSSAPGRLAGAVALLNGDERTAAQRFKQSIAAEPGGWFAWLGAGLAASALGDAERAHQDFVVANHINDRQPAVQDALHRVFSKTPLTSDDAFKLLVPQE